MLLSLPASESDTELRIEDAARLFAAPRDAWITRDWRAAWHRAAGGTADVAALMGQNPVVYGRIPIGVPTEWVPAADRLADRYATMEAFAQHAGRTTGVVSHSEADNALVTAVHALFDHGEQVVRVKVAARAKYGMYRIGAPDPLTPDTIRGALWSEMGWTLEHLDDVQGAFLVQQEVPMRCEYRLFVVGHNPVTGAGCIDVHTPLDNRALPFDSAVERVRGDGQIVHDPEVVRTLAEFGREVAGGIAVEQPLLSEYALDVALGPDGPLVVEVNGLRNSGLYASDPALVVAALLNRSEKEDDTDGR